MKRIKKLTILTWNSEAQFYDFVPYEFITFVMTYSFYIAVIKSSAKSLNICDLY